MDAIWSVGVAEVETALKTSGATGLTAAEARARLAQVGPNQLQEQGGSSPLRLFFAQFAEFMVWVLIGAAIISGALGEWVDTIAIVGIVLLNAILGFIQEYRAEQSLAALRKLANPNSRVLRDGVLAVVPSADLVPGDVLELEAGDHIPADCRLISQTANFHVQESSLTGESAPVAKTAAARLTAQAPLAERSNMVYMGTAVVSGRGRGLVAQTGMQTELGRIAGMIQAIEAETTPLQKRLDEFGKTIVKVCFVLVAIVFGLEWWHGGKLAEVFLTAVSLAVAAIPEGLPAVVTIALALGVQRMVKRHALIRKLPSVETLGCATVICSDKTGTLTRNEMTVQAVYAGGRRYQVTGVGYQPAGEFRLDGRTIDAAREAPLTACLTAGVLCNSAQLVEEAGGACRMVGDPTEGAILTAAAKLGLRKPALEQHHPYVEEIPFDAVRKMMSVVCRSPDGGGLTVYVKGAPDLLLRACTRILQDGAAHPLTEADRQRILAMNAELAGDAMRVLAVARRELAAPPATMDAATLERDLVFLGLVAMIDPPREEARVAIATCKSAGIRAVMITGDHRNTAVAVARELGLHTDGQQALSGDDLDALSDEELTRRVPDISVYARVSPEHKLRIVRCWRQRGEIVAMTGDGVNDAPAVKEADIGVAMGITGTDVTKEVSDMVVMDDNFASIVAAVEEGRGIYDNILKFVRYLLSCNAGEILVMFLASLTGLATPLLPIHILWVNLVTDGLPALALGMDPVSPGIMKRPPRSPSEPLIGRAGALTLVTQGLFIALCTLAGFTYVLHVEHQDLRHAQTVAFMILAFSQLFHAFNCRSQTQSLFKLGVFSNMKLIYAVLVSGSLQIAVTAVPFFQGIFKTSSLTAVELLLVVVLASFPLWAMETVKAVGRARKA